MKKSPAVRKLTANGVMHHPPKNGVTRMTRVPLPPSKLAQPVRTVSSSDSGSNTFTIPGCTAKILTAPGPMKCVTRPPISKSVETLMQLLPVVEELPSSKEPLFVIVPVRLPPTDEEMRLLEAPLPPSQENVPPNVQFNPKTIQPKTTVTEEKGPTEQKSDTKEEHEKSWKRFLCSCFK